MSSLPYELIALDLDMTLLNPQLEISPRNRVAVRRCRDLGVKAVISSGRMHASTLAYQRVLELDTPIISYNGALIKWETTGEVLLHRRVDLAIAREIVAVCEREGLHLNYYLDDTLYVREANRWARLYAERCAVPFHAVGDLRQLTDRAPTKLLIFAEPERITELNHRLTPAYGDRAYITPSFAEYLEVMPLGVDKGQALAAVAKRFGVPREKTIAFGDALNDVPALQWAGLGVAMANAKPAVKEAADQIAPHHAEDGVAVVLEALFGLPAGS
ncbi:MAG TPA: HAD family phosphatase [Armatimonadetes bacterium]|nr:HAD family phosphatase [Armatimonadota bacterium]